jgi:hypothetical protein
MAQGKVAVDNVHLVCEENRFRLPADLAETPQAQKRAATFRGEGFGTRHEAIRNPKIAALLDSDSRAVCENDLSLSLGAVEAGVEITKASHSSQMIYDFQVIKPGAVLFGGLNYFDLSELETEALKAALSQACIDEVADGLVYRLGAKSGIGMGRVAMRWSGETRGIVGPDMSSGSDVQPSVRVDREAPYVKHLQERRDEILATLQEAVA